MTARFGAIQPRNGLGQLDIRFQSLQVDQEGVDSGVIRRFTPNNAFRLGQQVFFWLGVANPVVTIGDDEGSANWITRIQLKPWWARPNVERRQAGAANKSSPSPDAYLPIDEQTFGQGPIVGQVTNNRYVWMPSPKRLDITEYTTAPPTASPPRNSDSLFVDDLWTLDLQDPNDAGYQAQFPAPQVVSRWISFLYPAMGYALGFTFDYDTAFEPVPLSVARPVPQISLSWATGTLGGTSIQDSIG